MAETILSREMINEIFKVTHCLLKFPQKKNVDRL